MSCCTQHLISCCGEGPRWGREASLLPISAISDLLFRFIVDRPRARERDIKRNNVREREIERKTETRVFMARGGWRRVLIAKGVDSEGC